MRVIAATDLRWESPEMTTIAMNATIELSPPVIGDDGEVLDPARVVGPVPFSASANDPADHGRDAHARAVAGEFGPIAPHVSVPPGIADLKARAAAKRYEIEIGGIVVDGMSLDTSRSSQAMITGAHAYVQAQPSALVDFKAPTGWVSLDAAAVTAVALAVGAHVQACFAAERAVADEIDAGEITTFAAVDAAAWPANG